MKSSYVIPAAIIFGGIVVAGAVYISMPKTAEKNTVDVTLIRPVSASDHILGNPTAPVMIVEYCDFDSEFCGGFNETLHQIIANEGVDGQVAWVFREFPLFETHPNAHAHARAVECAAAVAGNDAFWEFASALFRNQPVETFRYGELAASVGISGDAFATCYANASTTLETRITADRQNALAMGADGAPFSVMLVNGKNPILMDGAYPYDAVKALIDQALAK
jgi:protein-disulfide isomerase